MISLITVKARLHTWQTVVVLLILHTVEKLARACVTLTINESTLVKQATSYSIILLYKQIPK